ncbi:MAG: hypothetical protein M1828_001380 [Chrysothrix sp. TS-e1954]|nr:MAG: hypothetical protein M1828_001380 [Chrysothrix sp. TS-e1954]
MTNVISSIPSFLYSQLFVSNPVPQSDFSDRVVIITGSNRGLGLEAARHFHRLNASKIIIAVRDTAKGLSAAADIAASNPAKPAGRLEVWPLDISEPSSIVAFAEKAGRELMRLDAVVQSAGIRPTEWHLVNGHESTIAVNVLGGSSFCMALMPLMRASAWQTGQFSRFTFVGDDVMFRSKFRDWTPGDNDLFQALNDEAAVDWPDRYATSKLLLFAACREIARLCPLTVSTPVIVDYSTPGACDTGSNVARPSREERGVWNLFARSAERGSRTAVHAVSPDVGPDAHGLLFVSCKKTSTKIFEGTRGFVRQSEIFTQLLQQLEMWYLGISEALIIQKQNDGEVTKAYRHQLIAEAVGTQI